jgi:hypothetical protein
MLMPTVILIFISEALPAAKCLDRIDVLWHNAGFTLKLGVCLSTASCLLFAAISVTLPLAGGIDAG